MDVGGCTGCRYEIQYLFSRCRVQQGRVWVAPVGLALLCYCAIVLLITPALYLPRFYCSTPRKRTMGEVHCTYLLTTVDCT
jgi:hypothetical protein